MLYPIGIELGDKNHTYGVVVPDIPGCFSAGDTLEEAIFNVKEAIEFHISGMIEDKIGIPKPSLIEDFVKNNDYKGFVFFIVDVDLNHLMGGSEKINVTIPKRLLKKVDDFVAVHPKYKSRSNFLAQIASEKLTDFNCL